MQYRIAVAYQNAAWDQGSRQLEDLFQKVKAEEILRRMNLREFLVAFVQRQQRLFLSLPSIHSSMLENLIGKEVSREEIERDVQSALNTRTSENHALFNSSETSGPGLESPLASDLLTKAKVIERRCPAPGVSSIGNASEWKVSLATITADSYLHFFDVADSGISLSSTPESAFQVLMPSVIVPTTENLLVGKSNFAKGWSESLTPNDSVVLAKCVLQTIDESVFAVVEKGGGATAASKMFGKLVDRKIEVRTHNKADKDDWVSALMSTYC